MIVAATAGRASPGTATTRGARQGRGGEILRHSRAQRDNFRASCQAAELKIVASSIALAHPPVLLAFEFGFPPICLRGGSYQSY